MIEVRKLSKKLGGHDVLKELDLDIFDAEIFTLLGGSGSGKTVFLKNVVGLMKPDSGSVKIDGQEITGLPQKELLKVQSKIGLMFQGGALFDSLTVGENVAFGMHRLTNYSQRKIDEMVDKFLEMVGLAGTRDLLPESLSIGMRRRVALARAIATQPRYIFYDEPTTGLDPITTDVICELFIDMRNKLNLTSIMVTHDLNTAYRVSDRIALLYDGKIVEASETEKFKKSDNPYVQQFIKGTRNGPIGNNNGSSL